MSRITGNEVQGLMEAYNEVYAPQELTEEQVWEEVENWVYSLVEEGYDLSDYTWEDMYENYLNEMGQPGGNVPGGTRPISNAPYRSRFARPMNAGTPRQTGRGTAVTRPQIASLPSNYKSQELQSGARAAASQVGTTRQGTAGTGAAPSASTPRLATTPTPTKTKLPASATPTPQRPATRPAAAAATTPASIKPKPAAPAAPAAKGPTGMPLVGGIERRTPTSAELKAAQEKRAQEKSVASSFTTPISGAPKYTAPVFNLKQSFDLYDIIKGHLIDEGYADTEEAAEAIMVSMSEDWRASILEQVTGTGEGRPMEGDTPGNVGPTPPPKAHGGKGSGPKGKHPMPPPVTPPPSVK